MAQADHAYTTSRFHNLSNAALADAVGHTQRLQPDAMNLRFDVSRSASNANKNANRSEPTRGPNTNARKGRKHSRA
jgi:hypothetical protein